MRSAVLPLAPVFAAAALNRARHDHNGQFSCGQSEFYYSKRDFCLPNGGDPNQYLQQPPSDRSCPGDWYWHPLYSICVPRYPFAPTPACSGFYSQWDDNDQCCKRPHRYENYDDHPARQSQPDMYYDPNGDPGHHDRPRPTRIHPTPSCGPAHFFYADKACCLPNGGPADSPPHPRDRSCPSNWWWHDTYSCCVPKHPDPPPIPDCSTSLHSIWDPVNYCCKSPLIPPPTPSGIWNKGHHGNHYRYRRNLEARQTTLCPESLEECPIAGTAEVECVGREEIRNCGGCFALGRGQDCAAIPNVVGVSCLAAKKRCKVSSCKDGFRPSADGTSCVAGLIT